MAIELTGIVSAEAFGSHAVVRGAVFIEVPDSWRDPGLLLTATATQHPFLYVADQDNHRINVYNYDGGFQFSFGSYGTGEGEFDHPFDCDVFGDYVYVTDTFNARIQRFDLHGNYAGQLGSVGTGEGEFDHPMGIVVDYRYIWVVDCRNHRVQVFNHDGVFMFSYGSWGSGPNNLIYPTNISQSDTYVYVQDPGNSRYVIWEKPAPYTLGDVVVPMPTISATGSMRGNYVAFIAPMPEIAASGGVPSADVGFIMPMPTISAHGYIELHGDGAVEVPMPTISSYGWMPIHGSASLIAPMPTIEAWTGLIARLDVPMPTIQATGYPWVGARASLIAPMPTISAGAIPDMGAHAAFIAPMPTIQAHAYGHTQADANITVPMPTIDAHGYIWIAGDVAFSVPMPTIGAHAYIEIHGSASITFPFPEFDIVAHAIPEETGLSALVLNLQNLALSEYTNYMFNSLTKFNGKYIGCMSDGIWSLEGNLDGSAYIEATITYPTIDLDIDSIHRLAEIWLAGRMEGIMKIQVTEDEGSTFSYYTSVIDKELHKERVTFGRGLKGTFYEVSLKNEVGSNFYINNAKILAMYISSRATGRR
jgi:hypothetical protein